MIAKNKEQAAKEKPAYTPEELAAAGFEPLDNPSPPAKPRQDDLQEILEGTAQPIPPGTTTPPPQAEAKPEAAASAPRMTNFEYITQELKTKENTGRLALALGYSGKDEAGKSEAFKYISSVLQEIKKTEGDPKKDLTICKIDSIIGAMIDAATFRLPIDGRGLAHIVRYDGKATFQPGYKGFLYKIAEFYKDVDFTAEPVFEGDELDVTDNGGFQSYTHKKADPFQRDKAKMKGLIACLAYSSPAGRHSKVAVLPKTEIDQIREAAKQKYIWDAWYFEKAKVAALKRLCKIHFATVMGVQELAQWDNEKYYTMETPEGDKITPANSGKELSGLLEHKPVVVAPVVTTAKEAGPVGAVQTEKGKP